ncbi:MAG: hypothetical protein D6746_15325 [Bacteroidetes bacterium]|nr:MAG: hypothetical protein D6746_15325 [Bacteroidota bacterium]
MRHATPKWILPLLGVAWLALIGVGYSFITSYANTPGASAPAPSLWPANASISLDAEQPTLLLFLHPRCPCSRATLGELETLIAQVQARIRTHVFFFKPDTEADDWVKTDLWSTAASLPGVTVHVDPEGREALRFGALTSGHAVLYDPDGHLHFSGGITGARGHQGDNAGRTAIVSWIRHQDQLSPDSTAVIPVFGCALGNTFNPSPQP